MARKRLTPLPAQDTPPGPPPAPPPIARVAGAEAATAALREVTQELAGARAEGRLALRLPLGQIEEGWLVRDRLTPEGEEFEALVTSLRTHGQRMAIEVTELGGQDSGGGAPRYGLISGWRRLTALRRLHAETGAARFATVLAVLRRPEGASAAYLAMVEENEIRADLSHYERARIAARAAEAGVFPDDRAALRGLFGAASRPRRSKIGTFLAIYRALDGHLRFPAAIPERLGLQLGRALEADPDLADSLRARLAATTRDSAAEELALLAEALPRAQTDIETDIETGNGTGAGSAHPVSTPPPPEGVETDDTRDAPRLSPGIRITTRPGRVTLSGAGVDRAFIGRLNAWLRDNDF
ncbi:MAG: nuclease [Alkalilacustris sp.]